MHGHSYRLRVVLDGSPEIVSGWIMDFGELKTIVDSILQQIDHYCLNELPGLENPTSEMLSVWLWERLKPQIPKLVRIELHETATCGVIYEGK